MHFDYVVTLRRTSDLLITRMGRLLCIFTILILAYQQIRAGSFSWLLSLGALVILASLCINLFNKPKNRKPKLNTALFFSGLLWTQMEHLQWISLGYFLLVLLEYQAKRPLEIGFSKLFIEVNSLPKRKYAWTELSNVVLKDGLLTVDFKNNHLWQKQTQEEEDDDADEDEFNDFCRSRLAASQHAAPGASN